MLLENNGLREISIMAIAKNKNHKIVILAVENELHGCYSTSKKTREGKKTK